MITVATLTLTIATLVTAQLGRAEELAARQELDAAIDIYRASIDAGNDGAAIRYNLGTLELEQNDVGEAVLQLRTAKRYAPGDDDVRHNLAVALDRRADHLSGAVAPSPLRVLGERVHPMLARILLAIALCMFGVSLGALGFTRRRIVRVALAASMLFVGVTFIVYAARKSVETTREAVVLADSTPALKDADSAAATMFVAHAGLYGDVVDEHAPYVRVRFENGLEAWLARDALGFIE